MEEKKQNIKKTFNIKDDVLRKHLLSVLFWVFATYLKKKKKISVKTAV